MIGNILTAFIAAVFIDNVVLARFLGICPFLGVSQSTNTAVSMGAAVTFVMTLASAATWGIQQVLDAFGLGYLQTLAFILVIAALVQFVELFIRKTSDTLYRALGVYLPLITTNCAVLGICIVNIQTELGFVDSILNGAFAGIGFAVAIVLFSGIQMRMQEADIPEALKGFPSALVASSLVALAFFGFQGMRL